MKLLRSQNFRVKVTTAVRYFLLILIAIIMIVPLYWLFISSFRPEGSIFQYTKDFGIMTFIPKELTLDNYRYIFQNSDFPLALFNSSFVTLTTVVLGVLINSAAGFSFAVFDFKGKDFLFIIVIITFMMPLESIVIPLYTIAKALGLIDSYSALILPAVANGLVIFMFRQFLASVPTDYYDAARIDGLSWFGIYRKVAIPLAYSVMISGGLMIFIFQWESFFWPLLVTTSPDYVVVQIEISRNMAFQEVEWGRLFGTTSLATAVPMVLYLFFQKYFIQSSATVGIK